MNVDTLSMTARMSIMAAVILITSIILGATAATSLQKAFADPDRCFSGQIDSTITLSCNLTKEQAKQRKEDCRDLKERFEDVICSSSQTGFGVLAPPPNP
jgi:phosphoenolpyruvate-protein kinase (PTS system EI component)